MNENDFLKQNPTPDKPDNQKILEEVFGGPINESIAKVALELPESRRNRISFLLSKTMGLLTREQIKKGEELAGGGHEFGTLVRIAVENYINQQ